MLQKNIFIFLSLLLLTSCSLNPPDWLHGEWKQKSDSLKPGQVISIWTISNHSISHKTNKSIETNLESNSLFTITEIKEPKRYILRTDHVAEKLPYFQVFKFSSDNEVLYYDSTATIPKQEYVLTKTQPK